MQKILLAVIAFILSGCVPQNTLRFNIDGDNKSVQVTDLNVTNGFFGISS